MADDRMRNDDDLQMNMGSAGNQDKDFMGGKGGQQSPGRNPQGDQQTGGQQGGQQGAPQHKNPLNMEDDEEFGGGGGTGRRGAQGGHTRGTQNQ